MLHSRDRFRQWLPALFDGEFQWDFLKPAFNGTTIEPMDIDSVVERRGHLLMFETKIDGKEISVGQRITLTALWKKGVTIFVLRGKTPETITGMSEYMEGAYPCLNISVGDLPLIACKWEDVLFKARCWYCFADGKKAPTREEWDVELFNWDHDRTKSKIPLGDEDPFL